MTRHGEIEQQNVGLELPRQLDRFRPVTSFSDDRELGFGFQQPPQAIAKNGVVVGDQNANLQCLLVILHKPLLVFGER